MSGGLAERQAELVAALVAGAPFPEGFDTRRIEATRRSLLRKRAIEAAKAWPLLAASLGDGWPATFVRLREGNPPVGALRDGWEVARAIRGSTGLTPAAADELALWNARLRYDGTGDPRPRHLVGLRTTLLRLRRR
ncbi:hypothetical protein [Pseudonocardia sp. TRM90224]|uniref:hypothetical protein n=1 Tax=Pseudonocardia sp. TRM90224 TaxID=2812678 RepID=UPI001E302C76|nr:hypothetical protein [Pseudonocardia sp. TRM90224]